jgi:hypothetical protein
MCLCSERRLMRGPAASILLPLQTRVSAQQLTNTVANTVRAIIESTCSNQCDWSLSTAYRSTQNPALWRIACSIILPTRLPSRSVKALDANSLTYFVVQNFSPNYLSHQRHRGIAPSVQRIALVRMFEENMMLSACMFFYQQY